MIHVEPTALAKLALEAISVAGMLIGLWRIFDGLSCAVTRDMAALEDSYYQEGLE